MSRGSDIETGWRKFMEVPRGMDAYSQALRRPDIFQPYVDRLLAIILCTDFRSLGFYVNARGDKRRKNMLDETITCRGLWESLSPASIKTAAKIVGENIRGVSGIKSGDADRARRILVNLIPIFLPDLETGDSVELMKLFDVNATFTIWNRNGMGREESFDPLEALFTNASIDSRYKQQTAETQIHPQIKTEKPQKRGFLQKLLEDERPIPFSGRYAQILSKSRFYRNAVSPKFFVDELAFLIKHAPQALDFLDGGNFYQIMEMCQKYNKGARKALFIYYARAGRFTVIGTESLQLADEMLQELTDSPDIVSILNEQKKKHAIESEEYRKRHQAYERVRNVEDERFAALGKH